MKTIMPEDSHIVHDIEQTFKTKYNSSPSLFCSPGRINLIGEHTDYNNGLVLPAAIDKYIILAIAAREDNEVHIFSQDYQDSYITSLTHIQVSGKLWPDYIMGVIDQLQKLDKKVGGVNIVFGGNIPQGAGLSSSAAVECATAYALNSLFGLDLNSLELAKISQAAENEFVGVKCGLMDQFASTFGKENKLIKLDCETYEYKYIPFDTNDYSLILFDTQVKHSLASSAYNERRQQCEYGVQLIQKHHPEVRSLRQASLEMLDKFVKPQDEITYNRCEYIVREIKRVEDSCIDLLGANYSQFGKRMFQTHAGLRDQYEVSCEELDFLVDHVKDYPEVLGARMMGGGFGGCTINLIENKAIDKIADNTAKAYSQTMGKSMKIYPVSIVDGTRMLIKKGE
jgi:galactokinase